MNVSELVIPQVKVTLKRIRNLKGNTVEKLKIKKISTTVKFKC